MHTCKYKLYSNNNVLVWPFIKKQLGSMCLLDYLKYTLGKVGMRSLLKTANPMHTTPNGACCMGLSHGSPDFIFIA